VGLTAHCGLLIWEMRIGFFKALVKFYQNNSILLFYALFYSKFAQFCSNLLSFTLTFLSFARICSILLNIYSNFLSFTQYLHGFAQICSFVQKSLQNNPQFQLYNPNIPPKYLHSKTAQAKKVHFL